LWKRNRDLLGQWEPEGAFRERRQAASNESSPCALMTGIGLEASADRLVARLAAARARARLGRTVFAAYDLGDLHEDPADEAPHRLLCDRWEARAAPQVWGKRKPLAHDDSPPPGRASFFFWPRRDPTV
jgi:hypothetical protein